MKKFWEKQLKIGAKNLKLRDEFHQIRSGSAVDEQPNHEASWANWLGDVRKNPIRKLLLRNESDLESHERRAVRRWLNQKPQVKEVYEYKEAMRRVYRAKGLELATKIFENLINKMKASNNDRVISLRKTLIAWETEILNYHKCGLSNGRVEGFNRKAKLIQRRAYGLKNFENYRLALLNACRRRSSWGDQHKLKRALKEPSFDETAVRGHWGSIAKCL